MRVQAEIAVKKLPGVANAVVSLTAERPAGPAAPPPHVHGAPAGTPPRTAPPRPAPPKNIAIPGISRIIAVASGKGGVGKSTTTVNLALALASLGWKIGILDADVFGPSLPRLLGLQAKPEIEGKMLQPLHAFGIKAMSIGFLVAEEEAMIWRGPMVMSAINQLLREVAWGELDCLLVDMPPGTGDAQLTLAQNVPLAGAVIVSTPQDLALIDARRGISMFRQVNVPILGVVENMSYFICPHCEGRSEIFAHGGARHEAERLGVPFLGEVPLALTIREQSDSGRPTVIAAPDSPQSLIYREIAARLKTGLETGSQRVAPKIVFE
jgi:ATP-binding protein involved in chromosome partitioning